MQLKESEVLLTTLHSVTSEHASVFTSEMKMGSSRHNFNSAICKNDLNTYKQTHTHSHFVLLKLHDLKNL